MQSADSASGSGEGDAKGLVPPPHAQVDWKAATVLSEICAKCRPCCRGTASEGEWPSPVESPVRMLSDAATSPPSEAFTFSMASTLAARSAVEPESRPCGANVDDGANGPEGALCDDQSSDLGLSSGGLSHELEAVVPQSRNNPAVIFRVTHAGRRHKSSGCSPLASLPNFGRAAKIDRQVATHLQRNASAATISQCGGTGFVNCIKNETPCRRRAGSKAVQLGRLKDKLYH